MKREFLKGLGIEDDLIKQIMDENGRDIESAKGELEKYKQEATAKATEIDGLKQQIEQRNADIENLKKAAADNEALKTSLTELQTKYDTDTKALQQKLEDQKTEYAVNAATEKFFAGIEFSSALARDAAIAQFKAKGFKLDGETFQGGKEWIDELRKTSPDAFKPAKEEGDGTPPPMFTKPLNNNQSTDPNPNTGPFGGWNFSAVRSIDKK